MFYIYILTNKWHTVLYTGSTMSIEQRHFEHKNKLRGNFTKKYNCDQLVYFEEFTTRKAAEAREKQIKGWTRAKKIALIETKNPEWNDLAASAWGGGPSLRSGLETRRTMTTAIDTEKDIIQQYKKHTWPAASTYYEQPLVIDRGEGMWVWDDQGNRYLDCFGGVLTVSIGHANPAVNRAIHEQIDKVSHTSTLYITKAATDLAARVAQITPGELNRSFFTNSGTEADETALLVARLYTGRQEIVALRHGYHGRTMLSMSAAGQSTWRHGGTAVAGITHALAPYCYRCPLGLTYPDCGVKCAQDVEELIQTTTDGKIAALIAEPILGSGGFIVPPKEYFTMVTDIVKRYGGIFIADEVQTGWGRTGDKWCGIEHWNVVPDIITFAKGMGNGSPIGCTTTTDEIAKALPGLTFSTFGGNPVTSAAAKATIDFIDQNKLPRNAAVVGAYLRERLTALQDKYPKIGDVRGMGLMQAIECVEDRKTKAPSPKTVTRVFEETRKRGVLIGKGGLYSNVIRLGPPLIATKSDIDVLVDALDKAFAVA